MEVLNHNQTWIDTTGTYKVGTIQATRNQLEKAFGTAISYVPEEGNKVTTEWELRIKTVNGEFVASIHDWKRAEPSGRDQSISWTVAGKEYEVNELVHQAFRKAHNLALQYA